MDDARTKATLDALADLFLTGPAVSSSSPSHAMPVGGDAMTSFTRRAVAADELTGPRPIRMPPKLRPAPPIPPVVVNPPEPAAPPRQPLRLRRPEPIPAAERRAHTEPAPPLEPALVSPGAVELHVEAIFLGNLPGFGGPWLTQYAHRVAQRRGPVVVLHVDEQQIDIDLVTSNKPPLPQDVGFADAEAEAALDRWIDETGVRSLPELLKGLLEEAPVAAATWLIHLPGVSGAISPEVRALAARFDRWRVLCGADELAVSSAQRLLKQLIETSEPSEPGRPGPGTPGTPGNLGVTHATNPHIGLMVFGADEARSLQVADRLTALGHGFLRSSINLIGWQKQMVPVNLRTLGSYLGTPQIWPAVWSLMESHGGVSPSSTLPPQVAPALSQEEVAEEPTAHVAEQAPPPVEEEIASIEESPPVFEAAYAGDPDRAAPEMPDEALVEEELSAFEAAQMAKARAKASQAPGRPGIPGVPGVPGPGRPGSLGGIQKREDWVLFNKPKPMAAPALPSPKTQTATATPRREPVAEPAPAPQPAFDGEPDLSTFLPPGAMPLAARRPRHPHTQLALDEQGVIHLLHHYVPAHGTGDEGLRAAVVELIETRAWVREHFKLLAMTQRQLRFDRRARPVLHLFTDQAKLAAALTGRLGQFVRFHLLQRVTVGSQSTWFSTELN